MIKSKIFKKGVSLVEMMVVVLSFAILAILATRSLLLTIRGTKKGESEMKLRESIDYATAIIERQLRNATRVDCSNIPSTIEYLDSEYSDASFSCVSFGGESFLASSSARLTGEDVYLSECAFSCTFSDSDEELQKPIFVTLHLKAFSKQVNSAQKALIDKDITVNLRSF